MNLILQKRIFRQILRKFKLEKRERFTVATLVLSLGLVFTQTTWLDVRFGVVFFVTILTYPLTFWAVREDIKGIEWVTLFILPVLFTLSVSLFYFLLPVRWLTRLPTLVFFAIGMYAILLSENIFNVAANRSIQLLRAAQSVSFLISLVVLFLFTSIVFSFRLPIWQNFLFIFIVATFLFLQLFWSTTLDKKISSKLITYSLLSGIGIGEMAYAFSFWPIKTTILALFLSATFYTIGGIIQEYFFERLFRGVVREYLWVTVAIFILVLLATHWR